MDHEINKDEFRGFDTLYSMVKPKKIEGTTIHERYEVEKKIGHGGMSEVYKAYDTQEQKVVAIKRLIPPNVKELRKKVESRFLQEAAFLQAIYSPYVVEVSDAFILDHFYFLVMECIDGQNLKEMTDEIHGTTQALSHIELVSIMAKVARGLEAVHAVGIIHRDLKPSNIMVNRVNDVVKLLDLGLACHADVNSNSGSIAGTFEFMSPEQVQGRTDLTFHSDIYSFGMTFYYILLGKLPFEGSGVQFMVQVQEKSPRPPHEVDDKIPEDISQLVIKCLAKDRKKRYPSAAALAQELEKLRQRLIAHLSNISSFNPSFGLSITKQLSLDELYFLKVLSFLKKKRVRQRRKGAKLLGRLRDKRALKPLLKIMLDPEEHSNISLINTTIVSLGKLGSTEAVEPIRQILNTASDSSIRATCQKSLQLLLDAKKRSAFERVCDKVVIAWSRFYLLRVVTRIRKWLYWS
ncbi:serine/threonine protein kinase [Candidatus Uabimicrobium amorphum]|uniref:Serine/threonine protein kinase n=1 Tax=Uabimicrobium amorphum TaxID=2596890 RepID=A0A5S9IN22_UABAM|nr:serine/threonine-protein kinase [Candidatus Uabimicrobium amorphum]BBM83575.1 serine/threonine protein kinase [Candidatus Uabimicrobium amorphum]